MGDPKKPRKNFLSPRKLWSKERVDTEGKLQKIYGLKNKREIWRAKTLLRTKRHSARKLLALGLEERAKREKELIDSLNRIGVLRKNASLEDVLTLNIESFLERRLQTMVWRKGLALTSNQARQFVVHGKISVNRKKIDRPGYIVTLNDENAIDYFKEKMILTREPIENKKKKFEEVMPKKTEAEKKAEKFAEALPEESKTEKTSEENKTVEKIEVTKDGN